MKTAKKKPSVPRSTLYEMASPALNEQGVYMMTVTNALKKAKAAITHFKSVCELEIEEMERIYNSMSKKDQAFYKEELEAKKIFLNKILNNDL